MQDVGLSVAALAHHDGLAQEAARGSARQALVVLDDVAQARGDLFAQFFQEDLVFEVEEVFVELAEFVVGDVVGEGVDNVAEAPEVCLVILALVGVAAEAAEAPDHQARFARSARAEVPGHAQEIGAPDDGGAFLGVVAEDLAYDQVVLGAPAFELADLAGDGEVLVVAA